MSLPAPILASVPNFRDIGGYTVNRLPFYFTPEHEQFRASLRDFVAREMTPFVNEWDEVGK